MNLGENRFCDLDVRDGQSQLTVQTFRHVLKPLFLGFGNPKVDIQSKTQNQYLYDHYTFSILKYTLENKVAKVFKSGGLK